MIHSFTTIKDTPDQDLALVSLTDGFMVIVAGDDTHQVRITLAPDQIAQLHEATRPVPAWHTARFISASVAESGPPIGFVRHADGWVGHTGYKCSTARLESHFHNHEVILP